MLAKERAARLFRSNTLLLNQTVYQTHRLAYAVIQLFIVLRVFSAICFAYKALRKPVLIHKCPALNISVEH